MATTYQLISSNVFSSSATSITFSSIPSTYTDLLIKCTTRTDQPGMIDLLICTFNGSSAGNYAYTAIRSTSGSVDAVKGNSQTYLRLGYIDGANSTANAFASTEFYIPSYALTQPKQVRSSSVSETNGTNTADSYITPYNGLWTLTNPITSVTISPINGPNFVANSSFYLYGIKNS
jgi:hypothetical protein